MRTRLAVLGALLLAAACAGAAPVRIECPPTLPSDVVAMRARPDGWTPAVPPGYKVGERGVLTGPPDEQAYLVPDNPGAKPDSERWTFGTPHGYQHWVYCKYGPVVMAKPVSPDTKECVATETKRSRKVVFTCR